MSSIPTYARTLQVNSTSAGRIVSALNARQTNIRDTRTHARARASELRIYIHTYTHAKHTRTHTNAPVDAGVEELTRIEKYVTLSGRDRRRSDRLPTLETELPPEGRVRHRNIEGIREGFQRRSSGVDSDHRRSVILARTND